MIVFLFYMFYFLSLRLPITVSIFIMQFCFPFPHILDKFCIINIVIVEVMLNSYVFNCLCFMSSLSPSPSPFSLLCLHLSPRATPHDPSPSLPCDGDVYSDAEHLPSLLQPLLIQPLHTSLGAPTSNYDPLFLVQVKFLAFIFLLYFYHIL